jgi:O-antigen/teichoic acid export membrane protein
MRPEASAAGAPPPLDDVADSEQAEVFFRAGPPDRGRAVRAASLMVVSNVVQLVVGAVAVAVLARLLTPADFGLFTMAALLIGFVGAFKDFGLPMATVQSVELRHQQVSALFWLNLKLCGAMAAFVAGMGPVLAWFFGHRELVELSAVLAVGVAVSSIANIHQGLLARGMRFGAITATEVTAVVFGAAVGVTAAYLGAGYWALALQMVGFFLVLGLLPWLFCGWRPAGYRRSRQHTGSDGLRPLVHYGRDLSLSKVLTQLGNHLDYVLIGRFAGAGPLGLYQAAFRWAMLPVQQLYTPLTGVVVATLSRLRADVGHYRASFRTAVRASATLVLPVLTFLFVAAQDVVLLLLGEQWLGAVPIFQALALAAFLDVGRLSCKWVYLTEGRTRRQLRWTLIATPVMMLGISLGMLRGATGVAVGYALATAALLYPGVAFCMSGSLLRPRDVWRAVWRPALAAVAAAALLLPVQGWAALPLPLLPRLLLHGLAFLLLYAGAWLALPGGRSEAGEVLTLLRAVTLRPHFPHAGEGEPSEVRV